MASYPSATKSFTTHVSAQTIASADINAIQDEVVALENGLRTGLAHDVIPDTDNTRDLGSASKQFNDLFLGGRLVSPALDVDTTNFVNSATQPRALVYHSTTQSVVDSTFTVLAFDTESFDVGSLHDAVTNNSRLTVPTGADGLYLIIGTVSFAVNATGLRALEILKNGATAVQFMESAGASGTNAQILQVTSLAVLAATDYVELRAFQSSGAPLNIGAGATLSQHNFQMVKLW